MLARRREAEAHTAFALSPFTELPLLSSCAAPALQHVRLLESAGQSRQLRPLSRGTHVATDRFLHAPSSWRKPARPQVWADAACARLATQAGASVVLCSGAFEAFACRSLHEWEVPLSVEERGGSLLVFAGKPLLPRLLSMRAKNERYYKARAVDSKQCSLLTASPGQRAVLDMLHGDEEASQVRGLRCRLFRSPLRRPLCRRSTIASGASATPPCSPAARSTRCRPPSCPGSPLGPQPCSA